MIIFFFFFFLVSAKKPDISPNQLEIVINEGESLMITCTGDEPIKFVYPDAFGESVYTII